MPNSKHLTHGISNLVSLITKTKLEISPGVAANRVALEACVQARNEGRDLAREGNEIIKAACK
jgi:hypothetical protein